MYLPVNWGALFSVGICWGHWYKQLCSTCLCPLLLGPVVSPYMVFSWRWWTTSRNMHSILRTRFRTSSLSPLPDPVACSWSCEPRFRKYMPSLDRGRWGQHGVVETLSWVGREVKLSSVILGKTPVSSGLSISAHYTGLYHFKSSFKGCPWWSSG